MRCIAACFLFLTSLYAQNPTELSDIKNNPDYLSGQGSGKTLRRADKMALDDLVGQISVRVSSKFKNVVEEHGGDIVEYTKSVIDTYSNISLGEAKRIVLSSEPPIAVLRYIRKSDIPKIFQNRKDRILSFVASAQTSERDYRVGDALKNYYWALVLLQTHPDYDRMTYAFQGKEDVLKIALHARIDRILSGIKYDILKVNRKKDGLAVELSFVYGVERRSIEHLEFHYWDGRDWSSPNSVKDGVGYLELYDKNILQLKIRIKYVYDQQSAMDKELDLALRQTEDYLPSFEKSEFQPRPLRISRKSSAVAVSSAVSPKDLNQVKEVLKSVQSGSGRSAKKWMTPRASGVYQKLLKYGNAQYLEPKKVTSYALGKRKIIRSFPVAFDFPRNHKKFVEAVVFSKDPGGKIENLSFALSERSYDDIMDKHNRWNEAEKRQLIDFIEHYKTSYSLKRIGYLEQIFSEDALIIVGGLLKKSKDKDLRDASKGFRQVAYKKLSKKQYIARLRQVFARKDYVNIQFGATQCRMSRVEGVYGVSIEQNYYSSNYSDKGHLFLVVDFRKKGKPQIHVRTWQTPQDLKERGSQFKLSEFF